MSFNIYGIRAENRITKKRTFIVTNLTLEQAEKWQPTSYDKKQYRYFKVAKIKGSINK